VPPFFARYVDCPHSVVTVHLVDAAGEPTVQARDEILAFFAERLVAPAPRARTTAERGPSGTSHRSR
jgi:hypothetical protein